MKLGILSRNPLLYSTRRLVEAAQQRGHQPAILDTLTIRVQVDPALDMIETVQLHNQQTAASLYTPIVWGQTEQAKKNIPSVDLIIPRIGASITTYGIAIVRQFEMQGTPTMASSEGIWQSRDKLFSLQRMKQAGLPIPPTAAVSQLEGLSTAIQAVGGLPVVLKSNQSTQGRGVRLVDTLYLAGRAFRELQFAGEWVLIQKYIAEAKGKDRRVFVVGGKCIAAMERIADAGEFRSNLHLGGSARPISLSNNIKRLAETAVSLHNLQIAGVDIIQSNHGDMILEVNSSPGLEGIEKATQIDVAGAIMQHAERMLVKG